jgi:hypothetical protein
MSADQVPSPLALDEVRRRRAELRDAIGKLEAALAAPIPGRFDLWRDGVNSRLDQLGQDFGEHVIVTEGADGVYADVVASAPRLARAVDQLRHDHEVIAKQLGHCQGLIAHATSEEALDVRDSATDLIGRLVRHRQRGSDLMWDAYASDIGGET